MVFLVGRRESVLTLCMAIEAKLDGKDSGTSKDSSKGSNWSSGIIVVVVVFLDTFKGIHAFLSSVTSESCT